MNDAVLRATRHEVWATTEMLKFCQKLTPEQLRWTVPGTYGAVHNTLQHILRAQRGYLFRLTGEEDPGAPDDPSAELPMDTARLLPVSELIAMEGRVGERVEALLAKPFDPTRVVRLRQGTATAGIILAQFIHHGSDHRAHIGTILGANGVEGPNLDVWEYASAIGESKES